MVNADGCNPGFTSSQRSGVETVAPGLGRTLYAAATDRPMLFCR